MVKSRYATNDTIFDKTKSEPRHYATWSIPRSLRGYQPVDLLVGEQYVEYTWEFGDRLDRLSKQHLGDDRLWWIIAYVNNINYPLSISPGTVIKIPVNSRQIMQKLGLM